MHVAVLSVAPCSRLEQKVSAVSGLYLEAFALKGEEDEESILLPLISFSPLFSLKSQQKQLYSFIWYSFIRSFIHSFIPILPYSGKDCAQRTQLSRNLPLTCKTLKERKADSGTCGSLGQEGVPGSEGKGVQAELRRSKASDLLNYLPFVLSWPWL